MTKQRPDESEQQVKNRLRLIQTQLGMVKQDTSGVLAVSRQAALLQDVVEILGLEVPENPEDLKAMQNNRYLSADSTKRNPYLPDDKRAEFLAMRRSLMKFMTSTYFTRTIRINLPNNSGRLHKTSWIRLLRPMRDAMNLKMSGERDLKMPRN